MMNLHLKNKTALVLSGTKGIGYGVAYLLNQYGCKTIITSSSVKNLANVKKIMKKNCATIVLNIKSNKSVKNFIKKIKKEKIDILILNAPGPKSLPLNKCKSEDFKESINYLLLNMIDICESVIPNMRKNKFGRIINLSSTTATEPEENMGLSSIPRAGLASYIKTASREYAKNNLTFNTILTGGVLSERTNHLIYLEAKRKNQTFKKMLKIIENSIPVGYIADPLFFANFIIFLCSDLSGYINGASIPLDGGFAKSI